MKQIGVIGVGGVGGYFGGKLCQLLHRRNDLAVSFLARGSHLAAIQKAGLLLRSASDGELQCQPSLATDRIEELPPLDLCLLCVKEFDLPGALKKLVPKIGPHTLILPLLNGLDIYERIRSIVESGIVLRACVYVGTHIQSPGVVSQSGGSCTILFGPDPRHLARSPDDLFQLFREASIKAEWTTRIDTEIWRKFSFICAFGLVTSAHGKTLGEVLSDAALADEVRTVLEEVISVASALRIPLPGNILAESFEKARSFPPETKTSLQRDFELADKSDERDLFAGTLVRMARELQLHVPATERLSRKLDERKPRFRQGYPDT